MNVNARMLWIIAAAMSVVLTATRGWALPQPPQNWSQQWVRGAAGTTWAEWDFFSSGRGSPGGQAANVPDVGYHNPYFNSAAMPWQGPEAYDAGGTSFVASSGNIYSFSVAPNFTAYVPNAEQPGKVTTVVVQVGTIGNELDYESMRIGIYRPLYYGETDRVFLGEGPFLGHIVESWAVFHIPHSDDLTIQFDGEIESVSLDLLSVDTILRDAAQGYHAVTRQGTSLLRPRLTGDATHDGRVDISDLSRLATYFGAGPGQVWEHGDFNGDWAVTIADLAALASNFGASGGAGGIASSSAIPSPGSGAAAGLMVAAIGMGVRWRSSKQRRRVDVAAPLRSRLVLNASPRLAAGFTLIEMLVVIAIIAAVLAMMTPSLLGGRAAARHARTMSDLRQVMMGYRLYTEDHDRSVMLGYTPPTVDSQPVSVYDENTGQTYGMPVADRYPWRLAPYVRDVWRVLHTHGQPPALPTKDDKPEDAMAKAYSLSLSPTFGLNSVFVGGHHGQYQGFIRAGSTYTPNLGQHVVFNAGEVRQPSNLIVFAEVQATGTEQVSEGSGLFFATPPVARGRNWSVKGDDFANVNQGALVGLPKGRHINRTPVAMFDAHVEAMTPGQLNDMRLWANRAEEADYDFSTSR